MTLQLLIRRNSLANRVDDGARQLKLHLSLNVLSDGVAALGDGAEVLADLLCSAGTEIAPKVRFLHQATAAWERAIATKSTDGRTTRHPDYKISRAIRKRTEEANGGIKELAA